MCCAITTITTTAAAAATAGGGGGGGVPDGVWHKQLTGNRKGRAVESAARRWQNANQRSWQGCSQQTQASIRNKHTSEDIRRRKSQGYRDTDRPWRFTTSTDAPCSINAAIICATASGQSLQREKGGGVNFSPPSGTAAKTAAKTAAAHRRTNHKSHRATNLSVVFSCRHMQRGCAAVGINGVDIQTMRQHELLGSRGRG